LLVKAQLLFGFLKREKTIVTTIVPLTMVIKTGATNHPAHLGLMCRRSAVLYAPGRLETTVMEVRACICKQFGNPALMDASFVEKAIATNRPFVVRTASGDSYTVPHRDFIAFSAKKTTLIINFVNEGREDLAFVPLLTVTAIETQDVKAA
jgi:hypothetical protein